MKTTPPGRGSGSRLFKGAVFVDAHCHPVHKLGHLQRQYIINDLIQRRNAALYVFVADAVPNIRTDYLLISEHSEFLGFAGADAFNNLVELFVGQLFIFLRSAAIYIRASASILLLDNQSFSRLPTACTKKIA
jgi:hypothetical protein